MPPIDDLERIYARIGAPAIAHIPAYLDDPTHGNLARSYASDLLRAIAEATSEVRDQIVETLTGFLDRPSADDSAEEELLVWQRQKVQALSRSQVIDSILEMENR